MTRKSRRGYYVEGEFVREGSAADQQLRTGPNGDDRPSRTQLKQASEKLQELGEELLSLRADLLAGLPLPEKLQDAIVDARRINDFEGMRRQKQFIGRLMHRLDAEALDAVAAALRVERSQSTEETRRLHQAETWRDALIADDAQLASWLAQFPGTDAQQLRALIRQARKDSSEAKAGPPVHRGRAYRQIFAFVRGMLSSSGDIPSGKSTR